MNKRLTLLSFLLVLAAMLVSLAATAWAEQAKPLTVVELFTSQGCSSCPPADKVLGELAEREDLLPLSFHVDYWDYIGWKDPFADPAHTERQRAYAKTMILRYVYTPQIVVQGNLQLVGSDRAGVESAIRTAKNQTRVTLNVERSTDGSLSVTLPADRQVTEAAIYLIGFDKTQTTEIKRGENRGRTLTYHNVVRHYDRIGLWEGNAKSFKIPTDGLAGRSGCAILVQSTDTGRILGAAAMAL